MDLIMFGGALGLFLLEIGELGRVETILLLEFG